MTARRRASREAWEAAAWRGVGGGRERSPLSWREALPPGSAETGWSTVLYPFWDGRFGHCPSASHTGTPRTAPQTCRLTHATTPYSHRNETALADEGKGWVQDRQNQPEGPCHKFEMHVSTVIGLPNSAIGHRSSSGARYLVSTHVLALPGLPLSVGMQARIRFCERDRAAERPRFFRTNLATTTAAPLPLLLRPPSRMPVATCSFSSPCSQRNAPSTLSTFVYGLTMVDNQPLFGMEVPVMARSGGYYTPTSPLQSSLRVHIFHVEGRRRQHLQSRLPSLSSVAQCRALVPALSLGTAACLNMVAFLSTGTVVT